MRQVKKPGQAWIERSCPGYLHHALRHVLDVIECPEQMFYQHHMPAQPAVAYSAGRCCRETPLNRAFTPTPAGTGSGGRLLDACDLEADTIGGTSVPSSASSAVLSDFFIFDTEPLLADWGSLVPSTLGPNHGAPAHTASTGQPWAAGPTTGCVGGFGHTPAVTESSPFLLDGAHLSSTLPPK